MLFQELNVVRHRFLKGVCMSSQTHGSAQHRFGGPESVKSLLKSIHPFSNRYYSDMVYPPVTRPIGTPPATAPQPPGEILDWSQTPLALSHSGIYVKVIDGLFSPEDCKSLIALAESEAEWKTAAIHFGLESHQNYVNTNYRHSERILRFDYEAADKIYRRILPYVPELVDIRHGDEWEEIVDPYRTGRHDWRLVGVNERLSFLRYKPGNYFKPHFDGQIELPDGRKSRVTLQIYLSGADTHSVSGGATRIWGGPKNAKDFVDVEPRLGRVLLFQQQGIWHSGEDVLKGVRYALRSDLLFERTAAA